MQKFGHGFTYRRKKKWMSRSFMDKRDDHFGFMFPSLLRKPENFVKYDDAGRIILDKLGEEIASKTSDITTTVPAGYTYLGQFIDHDITLDPFSDIEEPLTPEQVEELKNFRTPALDLDSVYGRGPAVDRFLYVQNTGDDTQDGVKLLLGRNRGDQPGGPNQQVETDFDLPRTTANTAIIGDHRNDENLFISQIHHAFLKFHNAVVDHLVSQGKTENLFGNARSIVVRHYQWIVLHDFLKRVAIPQEIDESIQKQRFFKEKKKKGFQMPVEFSVAAYRFGHSLVRESYDFNENLIDQNFMNAFLFVRGSELPVRSDRVIDLNRFFDTGSGRTLNFTRGFDTAIAPDLATLPGAAPTSFLANLAKRNLRRSMALHVPTGQAVADCVKVKPLSREELLSNVTEIERRALEGNNDLILNRTPLWYYILKEAEVREEGQRLGRVGSIILAETFTRILRENEDSILNNKDWKPSLPRIEGKPAGDFDMADLVNFAGVL